MWTATDAGAFDLEPVTLGETIHLSVDCDVLLVSKRGLHVARRDHPFKCGLRQSASNSATLK